MAAEIVRFEFNIPVELALHWTDGLNVEGRYGPQVRFTLTDGRVMYLDPHVAIRIRELNIGAGERFTLTKRQKTGSNGKGVACEWIVQRVDPPAAPGAPTAVAGAGSAASATAVAPKKSDQGITNSNSPQANTFADFITYNTTVLTGVLCSSIDALDNATAYAQSKGRKLEFNEEDVRAVALTVYIQAARGGSSWASR